MNSKVLKTKAHYQGHKKAGGQESPKFIRETWRPVLQHFEIFSNNSVLNLMLSNLSLTKFKIQLFQETQIPTGISSD